MVAALWDARDRWFDIGARFGIKVPDLEVIRNEDDVDERFRRMIIAWLKAGKNCNWKQVCEALSHHTVGMHQMAEKLRDSQEDKAYKTDGWLCHSTLGLCCIACIIMSIIFQATLSPLL